MKLIFLNLLAFGALISSILVITAKNPVIAVIFLISTFVNSAGYLILLGIGFIGLAYIIIYVGAITVLFLFVIMLLNIRLSEIIETNKAFTKNLPLALIFGSIFCLEFFNILNIRLDFSNDFFNLFNWINQLNFSFISIPKADFSNFYQILSTHNPILPDLTFVNFLHIQAIGHSLYTFGAIWLIVTSLILLLAMIAPLFLTDTRKSTSN